ncbi:UNKNOWN [Stylonychia lemnae]|uniref:Uncharacterized protein n=1 Tax=Stylonychia lemnae TaxID=5949 RepID=A0A078A863_STYLE|nr:UNKNOWN [Stylonychia lemnae]|eukprot:CDW78409.1 UNKNOWN [Stylonychia lemnae]
MKLLRTLNQRYRNIQQRIEDKYFRLSDSNALASSKIHDLAPSLFKKTTPSERDLRIQDAKGKDFVVPFIKNDNFVSLMQKCMFSFKNIYSENINARNLCFVTGATKQGKSWFLRYNIRKFQNSSQDPLVVYYDFREQGIVSFDMFLFSFEKAIIDSLANKNQQMLQKKNQPIISESEFMKVVYRFYDKNLFEQDLAKCIDKATNNYQDKKELRSYLDKYRIKDYRETPIIDNLDKICEIISRSYQNDQFKARLLLVYDVVLRKEQEKKPAQFYHSSQFRSGIEVMNFLFDLINHIAGYTHKYYGEHIDVINQLQLVQKYRQEKETFKDNINQSDLLGDKYLHCLIVMESVQELYNMKSCGNLAIDYFDSLLLRLHNSQPLWYRNHFPVIMESNMSHYLNEEIYNDLQQPDYVIPTVEMLGFEMEDRATLMEPIFNRDQMKAINRKLGPSMYFITVFTELNKLYLHPELGDLLDNGDIDYAILDALEEFSNKAKFYLDISNYHTLQEFMKYPIIRALLSNNILYKSKYYNILHIEHQFYVPILREYVKEKKSKMTKYEFLRYRWYRKVNGIKIGSIYSGVKPLFRQKASQQTRLGNQDTFDFQRLYYESATFEDQYAQNFYM